MAGSLNTDPSENINWRRHKNACPFYRERWFPCNDVTAGEPMYQVFCMKGTPPLTMEEQERCFRSKTSCWRLSQSQTQEQQAGAGCCSEETDAETEKMPRKRRRAS